MRYLWAIILALLLCGCASDTTAIPAAVTEPVPSAVIGFYDADSFLEARTDGAVRVYSPDVPDVYGVVPLGQDLLILSGDGGTRLQVLSGDTLIPTAQRTIPFRLSADDPSLQLRGDTFSYFDPTSRDILVLDRELNTVSRIAVPEDLCGTPVLSSDGRTLYYCTENAVRAWDLESGIRRCVKDMVYEVQTVTGVHRNDTILECSISDNGINRTLFLSADTGSLLREHPGEMELKTRDDRYYAVFSNGSVQDLAFGETLTQALTPETLSCETTFLPEEHSAVTVCSPSEGRVRLEYYQLEEGHRTSVLEWDSNFLPEQITTSDGFVYILTYDDPYGKNVLYRWEPEMLPFADNKCYTGPYYSAESPDTEGLQRCQTYANVIGQQHGIQIKIGEAATAVQPWDYNLETEYLVPVLEEELHLLEQRLSHYPEGMLADTASHFSSLTICLVRSITGSAESGSLDAATGIQFFDGSDAYVVIAPGKYAQQALYHEMFHVMETHLLTRPTALDRWETLNPNGFRYDYSYLTNKNRDSGIYLSDNSRAFVDTYSMSFPKEDKARVLEYAMLPGMEALFQSEIMQAKLKCLSDGLREGYDLEKSTESFLWEQYLEK